MSTSLVNILGLINEKSGTQCPAIDPRTFCPPLYQTAD
jgi:hypothetical protein